MAQAQRAAAFFALRSVGVLAIGFVLILQTDLVQAATPKPTEPQAPEEFAEVVVTGEQPGPALWRVTSGTHVMWLLGGVSQLPGKVTWRSKQLETVLSGSQEVLLDGLANGPRTEQERITLKRATDLSDGKTLKEVLPPDLYARVEAARRIFVRDGKEFERLQPFFAGNRLVMGSMNPLGLVPNGASHTVSNLATKRRVPVTRIIDTEDFSYYLKAFENGATTPCLEGAVAILEDGGSGVRALANAWAVGNIEELRRLVPLYEFGRTNPRMTLCTTAIYGDERRAGTVFTKHAEKWLAAAERALAANKSTVAVVPISELFAPDGYLAALRARGYEVVEPH